MSIARQLYQLQALDLEIEGAKQLLHEKQSQIGQNQTVIQARASLEEGEKRHSELLHVQHTTEWEMDDLESKIKNVEAELFGGKIVNPKELTNLQHEVNSFRAKRDQVETLALENIEQVELLNNELATMRGALEGLEAQWQADQLQLASDVEALEGQLEELEERRKVMAADIDNVALEVYQKTRKQKGQAMSRVEQGTCQGCRISLSSSEMQRVRTGGLVQCGSCGHILYLP